MAIPIVRTDFELSSIYKSLKISYSNEELSLAKVEDEFKIFTNKNYNIFFPKLRFGMEATFRSIFSHIQLHYLEIILSFTILIYII